jgi:hypothetical protein
MMEAVRTSETSVNINLSTRRYIPEDSKLHTRCHENLKSHNTDIFEHKNAGKILKQNSVCQLVLFVTI